MEVPSSLTDVVEAPISPFNQYLLLNSEFRFDCDLNSIEFYATKDGSLNFKVIILNVFF